MFSLCVACLMVFAGGGAVRQIPVALFAADDVSDAVVQRICAEADAIWASAGITFSWHRLRSTDDGRAWPIDVTIDDRQTSEAPDGALGWLRFTPDGPDRSIHLSRVSAEGLLRATPDLSSFTVATHDTLIGRTLGRALAHELGHYLLRSKGHTSHGLMRAAWFSGQLVASGRDGFELTSEQRAAVLRWLSASPAPAPATSVAICTSPVSAGVSGQQLAPRSARPL